jgi:hypothetical protein
MFDPRGRSLRPVRSTMPKPMSQPATNEEIWSLTTPWSQPIRLARATRVTTPPS